MMIKLFKTSLFTLAVLTAFSACSKSSESAQNSKESETRASVIELTPTPFIGQKAKVRGENQTIRVADNLKDSVEQQELPNIWLEFDEGNSKFLRTAPDSNFNENLRLVGQALLHYQYVINNSANGDERFNASYNHSITFEKTINAMRQSEIDSPDGKRKLTEDEIRDILHKQAGLVNDRYFELDDYFKPKSAFYRFKKSFNEKLGYLIF